MKGFNKALWAILAIVGASCLGVVALRRGEHINALWIVAAAVSLYLVAYRWYGLFIAHKVLGVDPTRATPAWSRNDWTMSRPTSMCCSATTSPPLPAPVPWSALCWPHKWAICPARSG